MIVTCFAVGLNSLTDIFLRVTSKRGKNLYFGRDFKVNGKEMKHPSIKHCVMYVHYNI